MTKAADDYESIARHLKELEAEKQLALTGSSAPVQVEAPKDIDWTSMYGVYATPSGYNDVVRKYMQMMADCEALTSKLVFRPNSDYGY